MNPAPWPSVSWPAASRRAACGLQALLSLLLVGLALALAGPVKAQQLVPVPALSGRVVDLTQTLDAHQQAELGAQLEALEKAKGSQLVVLIVPSTQPEDIAQYSIRVAETWKIGRGTQPGKAGQRIDDGVILLVAKNDRKLRIEVGYGLEGAIPDAIAKRIITDSIAPRFKAGDYYGGIKAGVADLSRLIQGEALPAPAPVWQHGQDGAGRGEADPLGWLGPLFFVLILGFILRAILGRFLGSAAAGGAGWFTASMFGAPGALAVVAGVGIFLFLLIFAGSGRGLVRQGQRSYRSGPVFLPGGFGGGGGSGGGGFGGGGGGGFGGGGASGDW